MLHSLCGTHRFTATRLWVPHELCSYYVVQFVWYSQVHSNKALSTTWTVQLLCCTVCVVLTGSQQQGSEYHTKCAAIMLYSLYGTHRFTAIRLWVPHKLCSYYVVQFVWYSQVHSNKALSTTQNVQLLCCTVCVVLTGSQQQGSEYHTKCAAIMLHSLWGTHRFTAIRWDKKKGYAL